MTRAGAFYAIEHATRFSYSKPVHDAMMTLYLQPRGSRAQHVESFRITTAPGAELFPFTDCFGNPAHFFDIPAEHEALQVTAKSLVLLHPPPKDGSDGGPGWERMDEVRTPANWHMLHPTPRTRPVPALEAFVKRHGIERTGTPLHSIRTLADRLHEVLDFDPSHTGVDSPMEHALEADRGVCQDFAHIALAIVRGWGMPARYASGYLFPTVSSERAIAEAGHAWIECMLPGMGWVGADPTNNTDAAERHVRVAVGRDYEDVPPTRGTFRGAAEQKLAVSVKIASVSEPDGALPPGDGGFDG